MANYLNLDGISNYLQFPSFTFDKIVIDFSFSENDTKMHYFVDARTGNATACAYIDGTNALKLSNFSLLVNGNTVASNTIDGIPENQRNMVEFDSIVSPITDDVTMFARYTHDTFTQANVYDIKFYNAGVLVAHYDMTTGDVYDQSGNGHHATLSGGTWLDDGTNYEIAVTTQDYCNKTMDLKNNTIGQSFNNVKQTYDAPSDSCYVTQNGGWYLNDSSTWKYTLAPNTVYTLMDDRILSTETSSVQYSGGDRTAIENGRTANGYRWVIRTGNSGNFGFYISYDNGTLPRYTHPIMIKGRYHDCISRDTIYANEVKGGGTPAGTPVTYTYDTMQRIHSDFNLKTDFKLSQFSNRLTKYDTEQITYQTTQSHYDTKQSYFENIQAHYDTKQSFYKVIQTLVDTLQIIYHPTQLHFDIKQAFNDNISIIYDTRQAQFTNVTFTYDTEQVFSEAIKEIIKHVKLTGERHLHIKLSDDRQLHITLTGERHLHITMNGGN